MSNVLLNSQLFEYFLLLLLLLLSSSFIALWSDNAQGVFQYSYILFKLALYPKMWSILKNVPWAAEKNTY
jgi:hypothetical protein